MSKENKNIGFLGPEFLGLGLFSALPESGRERFRQWLEENGREFYGDQYALRDMASFELAMAYMRFPVRQRAKAVLGEDVAERWMNTPQPALGGKTPQDLAVTPAGVEQVLVFLGAIGDCG